MGIQSNDEMISPSNPLSAGEQEGVQDEASCEKQPSARYCFGCGLENPAGLQIAFYNAGEGVCRAEVTLDERFQGFPGIAHGGITATMLDEVIGRSPLSGNPDRLMFTAKLEVRYRQAVPLYTPLVMIGRIEKDRGRVVTATGELMLQDGTVLAEATATLMEVPKDTLNAMRDNPRSGWKVYP
jgi:acyl-coenzyme A thioesterase PaaI-like protein